MTIRSGRTLRIQQPPLQVKRLRVIESRHNASEVELVRLRTEVDQGTAARAQLELEREEAIEYRRDTNRRHGEEVPRLMAE